MSPPGVVHDIELDHHDTRTAGAFESTTQLARIMIAPETPLVVRAQAALDPQQRLEDGFWRLETVEHHDETADEISRTSLFQDHLHRQVIILPPLLDLPHEHNLPSE
jgi:hypothetical protein